MNVEALSVVPMGKSKQSEAVQRRIRRPFSVSEVEALVQAVEKLGTGRWRDVKLRAFDNAKHRTYVDLKKDAHMTWLVVFCDWGICRTSGKHWCTRQEYLPSKGEVSPCPRSSRTGSSLPMLTGPSSKPSNSSNNSRRLAFFFEKLHQTELAAKAEEATGLIVV
ncbi:unnamed protein product [Camellia sinensis]